jgi:hypothetical protein
MMIAKKMWISLSAWLCLAVVLTAGLGAAEQSYPSTTAPQDAQERADLLKAIQKLDEKSEAASTETNLYQALGNPYAFIAPSALETADALKAIQKSNSIYYGPSSEDSWYYWASLWMNGADLGDSSPMAKAYGAMGNPYAHREPSALELADMYKAIQKLNSLQYGPNSEDGWRYWANIWLQWPPK